MDIAIEVIPAFFATTTSLIKYLNAIINETKMKKLLNHIKKDFNEMMKLPQKILMVRGSMQGRKVTIYYLIYIMVLAILYVLMPLTPIFLDIIKPLNVTRERKLQYEVEYFVDTQTYYYQVMLHEYINSFFVINILLAVDTMFMVYGQHACTLLTILSNQLKYLHVMEDEYIDERKMEQLEKHYDTKVYTEMECYKVYQKLKCGIKLHKNVLAYSKLIQSSFSTTLAVQVFMNILGISFTGMQLVLNLDNADDVTRYGSFVAGQVMHLFFLCLPGQKLLDYSSQLYNDTCSSRWYLFPKNIQTVYKFLLIRSANPCKVTAGKFATMSMETFLSVVQTAMSYFTVLTSVR